MQYGTYLWQLLHLNLGTSLTTRGQSVSQIIQTFFPATAELAFYSLLVAIALGLCVGLISATRPNTAWDAGGRFFGIITYAFPPFWAAMLLQLIFAVQLGWFPIGTRWPITLPPPQGPTGLYTLDSLLHGNIGQLGIVIYYLALPCLSLGLLMSGAFERIVRVNLRQTLQADYVEAGRARGIPERRLVINHALRNALIPVVTMLGLTFAALLGGALLIEVTFSWPGLANRLYEAISLRDYPTVQGIVVFFAALVVLVSIGVDLINAWIDPRIRY
jgi:peptide/nickel transport system permease protein